MFDDDSGTVSLDVQTLWLAACRARESLRPDRILDDPYAAHLAGSHAAEPVGRQTDTDTEFAAALRAVTIDQLLLRAILAHHLHAVVDLGAGLDTRPYRLGLPSDLRWVELDREPVFVYKALRLAHATPTCRVERLDVDVSDSGRRDALLRRVSRSIARGLLFTEDARASRALPALQEIGTRMPAGIKWWIVDLAGRGSSESVHADQEVVDALCADHWQIVECRPLADQAHRLAPSRVWQLEADRDRTVVADLGAVWMLHRSS